MFNKVPHITRLVVVFVMSISLNACVSTEKANSSAKDKAKFDKVLVGINGNKKDSDALLSAVKAKNVASITRLIRKYGYDGGPIGAPDTPNCFCTNYPSGTVCACHGGRIWMTQ
jgi:hypothetical protein